MNGLANSISRTEIAVFEEELIPERYQTVVSRLGVQTRIANSSNYLDSIKVLDTNSEVITIRPNRFMTGDEELDRVMRPFLSHLLERYMPRTLYHYEKLIDVFTSTYRHTQDLNGAIEDTVINAHQKGESNIGPFRNLIRWFIAYEVEGLNLDLCEEVLELTLGNAQNAYLALYSLDAENGPFVREELRILQAAALNPDLHLEDRVVLKLCLEFGLRPIQISLLKQSDFIVDDTLDLAHLRIPRVKQKNQYRRTEFTDRLVSNELKEMLTQLIQVHDNLYSDSNLNLSNAPLIMRRHTRFFKNNDNHPYIMSRDNKYSPRRIINQHQYKTEFINAKLEDVTHHISAKQIDYRLDCIAELLPNSPRTGRPFQMNAYRFRYTLGTNAVTQGMTEIEVQDLLDHSSQGSVKHYFHYTHEMFEILEESTLDRIENKFFTAAWRKEEVLGNIYGEEIIEPQFATSIGKCQKGSPCTLEPAVACYQCDKFCPNKNIEAHKSQLESLKGRAELTMKTSNREVAHQFDEAIAGCIAAIAYSKGQDVLSIQDKSLALLDHIND